MREQTEQPKSEIANLTSPVPTRDLPPALSQSAIVAGALFDFMGMLTSQDEETHFSAHHDASPAVDMLRRFAAKRNFNLEPCDVAGWHKSLAACEALSGAVPSNKTASAVLPSSSESSESA